MNDSIRLGSIRGIRIGAHWSVLVIAWLLGWGLSTRFLPEAVPGLGPVAYWAAGAGVAVGAAMLALNKGMKAKAQAAHVPVTINDLEKDGGGK